MLGIPLSYAYSKPNVYMHVQPAILIAWAKPATTVRQRCPVI
jgi:hypothetical protein